MDWDAYNKATEVLHEGRPLEALRLYQSLHNRAETPDERAAFLIACGGCYAQLGNRPLAFNCIAQAHSLEVLDSVVKSQIDLAEADLHLWCKDYQLAAEKFQRIEINYQEVLRNPEHKDFAQELKSRYADSLTFLGNYSEAIPILKELIATNTDVRQHSFLYLGICLVSSGFAEEGRKALLDAAQGDDKETTKEARKWLAYLG